MTIPPASQEPADQVVDQAPPAEPSEQPVEPPAQTSGQMISSSAIMAIGTVVSRASGFVRTALLVAALGTFLHADIFNVANSVPNVLYVLIVGGVLNAVLVPQIVRATKHDADGGAAYINRIITLGIVVLTVVTAILVIAAPWVMKVFLSNNFYRPDRAEQLSSAIAFARYCLPQVFFYGMFVLVGQVLNARHIFGPMMWAPIANNVVACAVLISYLLVFGQNQDRFAAYTPSQELLLGMGSTFGILCQLLILLPYLRRARVRYRPRFDFLHTGLGTTFRLAGWTLLYVVVSQICWIVVTKISSGGAALGDPKGTGFTVYNNTFQLLLVPHAIITVSLATAMLPQLSRQAEQLDFAGMRATASASMRHALLFIMPFAVLIPVIAWDLASITIAWGAASSEIWAYPPSMALLAPGLIFFTIHFILVRSFYALERTRTVFWIQSIIAGVNIALAVGLTRNIAAENTSPRLILAYAASYVVGSMVTLLVLRRALGSLDGKRLLSFIARVAVAAVLAAGAAAVVAVALHQWWGHGMGWFPPYDSTGWTSNAGGGVGKLATLGSLVLTGVADLAVFIAIAKLLRVEEISVLGDFLRRRLGRGRAAVG